MKKLFYILSFLCLCLLVFSCKKQNVNANILANAAVSEPIYFEIVDKNGKGLVHSVNDTLVVTYIKNGVTQSYRLDVFKVQLAVDDTVPVPRYNGFLISDDDITFQSGGNGFMVSPRGGVGPSSPGTVRNFIFI